MWDSDASPPVNLRRRDFLIRSCQSASATLIPATFHGFGKPPLFSSNPIETTFSRDEFHLHPHYRMPRPLGALLLKTKAGLDEFVTEKYADEIAAILAQWSAGLLRSPHDIAAIEMALLTNCSGASLRSSESRLARPGPAIEVRHNNFPEVRNPEKAINRDVLISELRLALSDIVKILTAEFQVTSISVGTSSAALPARLETRVRYELVGEGRTSYREQRVGYWQLDWERTSEQSRDQPAASPWRIRNWLPIEETVSRSAEPVYVDVTSSALGANASYSAQLLQGTDYWRTVLDGACGLALQLVLAFCIEAFDIVHAANKGCHEPILRRRGLHSSVDDGDRFFQQARGEHDADRGLALHIGRHGIKLRAHGNEPRHVIARGLVIFYGVLGFHEIQQLRLGAEHGTHGIKTFGG